MEVQKAIRHAPLVKTAVIVLLIVDLVVIGTHCFYNFLSADVVDIPPGVLSLLQWLNATLIVPYMVKSGYEHAVNKREETKIYLSKAQPELEGNGDWNEYKGPVV